MNKTERILKIAKEANESDRIIVFVNSFKIVGHLHKESEMHEKGILTLKDATVCNSLENFECTFSHHTYKWLNVFEDEIIAFSISQDYAAK